MAEVTVLISAFQADYFGIDQEPTHFLVIGGTTSILDEAAQLAASMA